MPAKQALARQGNAVSSPKYPLIKWFPNQRVFYGEIDNLSHKLRTVSPRSLDVRVWRIYLWSESASVRSFETRNDDEEGIHNGIPHRRPQFEVRCRATGIPRQQAGLANREADMPSGEPITRSFVENRSELRYNTSP